MYKFNMAAMKCVEKQLQNIIYVKTLLLMYVHYNFPIPSPIQIGIALMVPQ